MSWHDIARFPYKCCIAIITPEPPDATEAQVTLELGRRRLTALFVFATHTKHIFAVLAFLSLVGMMINGELELTEARLVNLARLTWWLLVLTLMEWFPQWFTLVRCKVVLFAACFFFSLIVYTVTTARDIIQIGQLTIIGNCALVSLVGENKISFALNVATCGVACHAYSRRASYQESQSFICIRFFAHALIALIGHANEMNVRAVVRASFESKESQQLKGTVETLLSVLCDAMLTLNADFQMIGPTPKLEALLLTDRPLQQRSFLELMPSDDAVRFQKHIENVQHDDEEHPDTGRHDHALSLNVHLRASSGVLVSVKLFLAPFWDFWTAQPRYLVGVAELGSVATTQQVRAATSPGSEPADPESSGGFGTIHEDWTAPPTFPSQLSLRVVLNTKRLILREFEETPMTTVQQLICALLVRLNIRGKGCCFWHVGLSFISAQCKRMVSTGCFHELEPASDWQCADCFAMSPPPAVGSDRQCDVCGDKFCPTSHVIFES